MPLIYVVYNLNEEGRLKLVPNGMTTSLYGLDNLGYTRITKVRNKTLQFCEEEQIVEILSQSGVVSVTRDNEVGIASNRI